MSNEYEKRCPLCGKTIWADATFCSFCNRDLEDEDLLRSYRSTRRIALALGAFFGFVVLLFLALSLIRG